MHLRNKFVALAVTALLITGARTATAQATATAYKRNSLDAFFTYGRASTDYGPTRNNVMSFGADYMFLPTRFGQPGINLRYIRSTGTDVNEGFMGGGLDLRFQVHYHIRPYIAVDYGIGSIKNNHPAVGLDDSGGSLLFAGGGDIPITPRIAARVEAGYQKISLKGGGDPSFSPFMVTAGVIYNIR